MKNADRILGVIYNYMPLEHVIVKSDLNIGETQDAFGDLFDLSNLNFRQKVVETYIQLYPSNYNEDVVNLFINQQIEILERNFHSTNTIYLFLNYSEQLFCIKNNQIYIDFDKLFEWDGFANKLDTNIFYGAYLSLNRDKIDYKNHNHTSVINHTNVRLYNLLSKGLAENHMHLEASGYSTEMNLFYFMTTKFFDFDNDKDLKELADNLFLKKTLLCRILLFDYMQEESILSDPEYVDLITATQVEDIELYISKIKKIQELMLAEFKFEGNPKIFLEVERVFLSELFFELNAGKIKSTVIIYIFNIYLYSLSKLRFKSVLNNRGIGFSRFSVKNQYKTFWFSSEQEKRKREKYYLYLSVFDKYYSEKSVEKIEIRIAVVSPNKLKQLIDILNEANEEMFRLHLKKNSNLKKIKYGLILHFSKPKTNLINLNEKNFESFLFRNEKQYKKINKSNKKIIKFFDSNENSDEYTSKIVGVDAANDELSIRPEMFGPVFRGLRSNIRKKNDLNFTFHVGEEFNTLCSGLRAVDEVIEFLYFQRGDRLGHALSLGLDVDDYIESKRGFITTSLQDYLDDIIWLYHIISNVDEDNSTILDFLSFEFHNTQKELFQQTNKEFVNLFDYLDSYKLRGDYPSEYINLEDEKFKKPYSEFIKSNSNFNFKNKNHENAFLNKIARELYNNYHYDEQLKRNGAKVKIVEAKKIYIDSVKLAQGYLKEKIIKKGISIETNPTSNKKISSVNRYIDLPSLKMNQLYLRHPYKNMDRLSHIPLSVNTDDSSVF